MASIKERLGAVRERYGWIDHVVRMQEHFGSVKAGQQAGAITYFAFLSFFPILALAFFTGCSGGQARSSLLKTPLGPDLEALWNAHGGLAQWESFAGVSLELGLRFTSDRLLVYHVFFAIAAAVQAIVTIAKPSLGVSSPSNIVSAYVKPPTKKVTAPARRMPRASPSPYTKATPAATNIDRETKTWSRPTTLATRARDIS